MKKKIIIFLLILLFIFTGLLIFYQYFYLSKIEVLDVYEKNDQLLIKINNDGSCKIDKKWIKSKSKICAFETVDTLDKIYLKNKYNNIFEYTVNKDFTVVNDITVNIDKAYLAINGEEKLEVNIDSKGNIKDKLEYKSENENIAVVSDDGVVTGISNGETNIIVKLRDKEKKVNVIVTDLITTRPDEYNFDRSYLTCNQYTEEQNDLLDEILKYRVNKVGFKTRASVVEAARFIALEFPYRIAYFSENGRLHPYGVTSQVDGEGRYYHEGLYLNSSRYSKVSPKMHGPGTWGCQIYSNPSEGYRANGFDCSGFISWIILNGGFDCEDVGAGVSSYKDLTDLGERIRLTTSTSNNSIKAGDLLSGKLSDGGHIALVAGLKDGYYYVAESLWFGTGYFGSLIRKYDVNDLHNHFYWHVDMQNYYGEDGNYTEYWK